ncbi:hemolysin family protein, partial [Terrisporobacter sp.]|uniref:hemolysin family protein n=1 Tax=Terrisporobacter sp. TaxID=1965305 RepID=UPI00261D67AA
LILSYFTLVFGELVPKRIALKKAEKISLISVKPIYFISKIAKPFIKLLSLSTTLVLKITRNNDADIEEKVSEEEIKSLISQSQEDGCIERDEEEMIYGVFDFNDKTAKEIMTPRNELFAINMEDDINNILDDVLGSSYSRIPVYKDTIDNIVGILYTKDLLVEARRVGFDNIQLKNILQKPFFALETRRTNELFKVLKDKKVHLAILFDEYGGTVGIVTMEDLIEEIVGDIEDEYDSEECLVTKIDENNFFVKASMTVTDFNDLFDLDIEIGEYDTLNGYLLTKLNRIPDEGSNFQLEDIEFTVIKVENRRIENIKITLKDKCEESLS